MMKKASTDNGIFRLKFEVFTISFWRKNERKKKKKKEKEKNKNVKSRIALSHFLDIKVT